MNKKTLWQKIYSFFGFWFYYKYNNGTKYKILYWCCFPWGKYYRKIDLFKFKCGTFEENKIFRYRRNYY